MAIRTTRQLAVALGLDIPRDPIDVTIVLPAYNEAETLEECYRQIEAAMAVTGLDHEFIYVDDGSSDATWQIITALAARDPRVRGIKHRRRTGKASALANGFAYARGAVVATCDADLQYEASDVVRVIEAVRSGYDAVSARKTVRRDGLSRILASKFFNFFVRKATGVQLHDMNAGLKAYTRDAAQELVRFGYGELHRFFIVLLALKGYSVTEIDVESLPRPSGRSKYGLERYLRGAMDFLTVFFLSGYVERPLHLFGGLAVAFSGIGTLIIGSLFTASIIAGHPVASGPYLEIAMLFILSGVQLFVVGLVAEMIHNLEHGTRSNGKVSEVIGIERRSPSDMAAGRSFDRRVGVRELLASAPSPKDAETD